MKIMKLWIPFVAFILVSMGYGLHMYRTSAQGKMPEDFVFLCEVDPTIIEHTRYYTDQNFLGRRVTGYTSSRIIGTKTAAEQLRKAHSFFKKHGYTLVVYDGYRPTSAVAAFKAWSLDPNDRVSKAYYYPTLDKPDMFRLGYIAERSTHSRGSTFDLTLIPTGASLKPIHYSKRSLANGEEIPFLDDNTVDMGSSFDLFHEVSHHDAPLISPTQADLRNFLRKGMQNHGFKAYAQEWWHYTLENEPYPDTYFDFTVEK